MGTPRSTAHRAPWTTTHHSPVPKVHSWQAEICPVPLRCTW